MQPAAQTTAKQANPGNLEHKTEKELKMEYLKREVPKLEQNLDKERADPDEEDLLKNIELGKKRMNN